MACSKHVTFAALQCSQVLRICMRELGIWVWAVLVTSVKVFRLTMSIWVRSWWSRGRSRTTLSFHTLNIKQKWLFYEWTNDKKIKWGKNLYFSIFTIWILIWCKNTMIMNEINYVCLYTNLLIDRSNLLDIGKLQL